MPGVGGSAVRAGPEGTSSQGQASIWRRLTTQGVVTTPAFPRSQSTDWLWGLVGCTEMGGQGPVQCEKHFLEVAVVWGGLQLLRSPHSCAEAWHTATAPQPLAGRAAAPPGPPGLGDRRAPSRPESWSHAWFLLPKPSPVQDQAPTGHPRRFPTALGQNFPHSLCDLGKLFNLPEPSFVIFQAEIVIITELGRGFTEILYARVQSSQCVIHGVS